MALPPDFDKGKAKAFTARVLNDVAGTVATRLCAIGDRLGLFRDLLEHGTSTGEVLARRTGIDERYAREWLQGMAAAGYLEVQADPLRYTLPAEHAMPLANDDSPIYQGGLWELMTHSMTPFEAQIDAFKNGGGVHQTCFHPALYQGMRRSSGLRYKNFLLQQWLPSMPDLIEMLERGVDAADVGCGNGTALLYMAGAFPRSRFVGYDAFAPQVEGANRQAAERGMAGRVEFEVLDASAGLPRSFDVITTFDVIHDMAHPRAALRNIREHLAPDGIYVLQEITSADAVHENLGPQATIKYGMSISYCMTTSLAAGGEGLGTLGMPERVVRELCTDAGFSTVEKMACSTDFISLYEVRP